MFKHIKIKLIFTCLFFLGKVSLNLQAQHPSYQHLYYFTGEQPDRRNEAPSGSFTGGSGNWDFSSDHRRKASSSGSMPLETSSETTKPKVVRTLTELGKLLKSEIPPVIVISNGSMSYQIVTSESLNPTELYKYFDPLFDPFKESESTPKSQNLKFKEQDRKDKDAEIEERKALLAKRDDRRKKDKDELAKRLKAEEDARKKSEETVAQIQAKIQKEEKERLKKIELVDVGQVLEEKRKAVAAFEKKQREEQTETLQKQDQKDDAVVESQSSEKRQISQDEAVASNSNAFTKSLRERVLEITSNGKRISHKQPPEQKRKRVEERSFADRIAKTSGTFVSQALDVGMQATKAGFVEGTAQACGALAEHLIFGPKQTSHSRFSQHPISSFENPCAGEFKHPCEGMFRHPCIETFGHYNPFGFDSNPISQPTTPQTYSPAAYCHQTCQTMSRPQFTCNDGSSVDLGKIQSYIDESNKSNTSLLERVGDNPAIQNTCEVVDAFNDLASFYTQIGDSEMALNVANIARCVLAYGKDFAKATQTGVGNAAAGLTHDVTHPIEFSKKAGLGILNAAKFIFSEMAKLEELDQAGFSGDSDKFETVAQAYSQHSQEQVAAINAFVHEVKEMPWQKKVECITEIGARGFLDAMTGRAFGLAARIGPGEFKQLMTKIDKVRAAVKSGGKASPPVEKAFKKIAVGGKLAAEGTTKPSAPHTKPSTKPTTTKIFFKMQTSS